MCYVFFEYFVALRCFFNFFTGASEHMVLLRSGVEQQECVGGFIFMLYVLYELLLGMNVQDSTCGMFYVDLYMRKLVKVIWGSIKVLGRHENMF